MKIKIIISLVFLFFLNIGIISYVCHNPTENIKYLSKEWRHRGGIPENNISSIIRSLNSNFKGIEIDVYYHNDKFFLTHDEPKQWNNNQTLKKLLLATEDKNFNLWIDFKNINIFNSFKCARLLKNVLRGKSKLSIIESKSIFSLIVLNFLNLNTSLWVTKSNNTAKSFIKKIIYPIVTYVFNFNALSFDISYGLDNAKKINSKIPLHIFTIKNQKEIKEYTKDPRIKVIITSLKQPIAATK